MLIGNAVPLRIKNIVQAGLLQEGRRIQAEVTAGRHAFLITADWTAGSSPQLQLYYRHSAAGIQDYTIEIDVYSSNLGVGRHFYLICPVSGRRCRTLYLAYDYPKFKAREAFYVRLYYPLQLTGGRSRYNAQYFAAEDKVERLQKQRAYVSYKGRQTRYAQRVNTAIDKVEEYDFLRWTAGLPAVLCRQIAAKS